MEHRIGLTLFQLNLIVEDGTGVLGRILQLIYKSNYYLKNVNIYETDVNGSFLIAVEVVMPASGSVTMVRRLERIIEVEKVVCIEIDSDDVRTIAHYRLTKTAMKHGLNKHLQRYDATVISMDQDGIIVEKIGRRRDVLELYSKLKGPNQLSFCCSSLQTHESLSQLASLYCTNLG